jgi:hypothetical protein
MKKCPQGVTALPSGISNLRCIPCMMKILFFLFIFPLFLRAQPFLDVVSAYYQYSAADKPVHNNTLYTELASVALTIPLKIDSDYFVISPVYENFTVIFPLTFVDRQFHAGYVPLTWLHRWNTRWKTAFVFIPRVSSALNEGISGDDMQYGGAVLASYERKTTLKYKTGVYYNSEFFGPFFMPLLGIDWNISPRLNLFGVLPGSMNLEYKFNKSVHGGVIFRSITNSYRTFGYNYIRVNDNHLKLFMDFYLAKSHAISIEAGHTILRKYVSGFRKQGDEMNYSMNVTDGLLFRVGYSLRIRTDGMRK